MDLIVTGNGAIARAARDAGAALGVGYPGTPSTEVLETLATLEGGNAQWAPNEKVALEVGVGVAIGGRRALVTMKHVGLNVAADPLFTAAYTGVAGGLVVLVADDPGMHSSQNEQDSRHYARAAKVPMLEPADSQEAYDFTRLAFQLSEEFDTPVLLRTTTRLSHGKSTLRPRAPDTDLPAAVAPDDPAKYVMVPANARKRHVVVEDHLRRLQEWAETGELTRAEYRDRTVGIVTSGINYQYVREVAPEASVLKLGMVYPLPIAAVKAFAAQVETLYVVEELDPIIEEQIRAAGITVIGKERFPIFGEFNPTVVVKGLGLEVADGLSSAGLPMRPPAMCPGCPHRAVFWMLKKNKLTVTGDIGCYTLGVMPPLQAMDTCICMGAAIGVARGLEEAGVDPAKVVGVIGDSTFLHSGITGLLDMVYNRSRCTVMILDNSTTAMTGRQEHPGTGKALDGTEAPQVDLESLVRALGVPDVTVLDPYDLSALEAGLQHALAFDGPSVVIARRPCMLIPHEIRPKVQSLENACKYCGLCLRIGCPAISKVEVEVDGKTRIRPEIDPLLCNGCAVCASLCKFDALIPGGKKETAGLVEG
ncbi:MAG: indolepyruvate ferredoxin oxidoreductase subunit alpha [Armatimonadota bacterium]